MLNLIRSYSCYPFQVLAKNDIFIILNKLPLVASLKYKNQLFFPPGFPLLSGLKNYLYYRKKIIFALLFNPMALKAQT